MKTLCYLLVINPLLRQFCGVEFNESKTSGRTYCHEAKNDMEALMLFVLLIEEMIEEETYRLVALFHIQT